MGYGIIPNYEDEAVVCQQPCQHRDCEANRNDFIENGKCVICRKELEIGQAFYYEDTGKYDKAHAHCVMERAETSGVSR